MTEFQILINVTRALQERGPLDALLRHIADGAAALLDTPRVSVRLLDPARERLLATCRAGAPTHLNPGSDFKLGEGLIGWIAQQAGPIRTGDAERDPRFVPRDDIKERMGSFLGVPIISGQTCLGVLSALHPDPDRFTAHHEELLTLLAGICAPHVEVARLARLSQVDPLTGALNRRGLEGALPEGGPTGVIMADIDNFKRINDHYGHAIGDEVLKRAVQILGAALREHDAVIRWGGEEFLLALPGASLAAAASVAERARVAIAGATIPAAGVALRITLSFGVAERFPDETREQTIARADAALYAAKETGRNRVVLADRRGK